MNAQINANVVEAMNAAGLEVLVRRNIKVVGNSFDRPLAEGEYEMSEWLNKARVSSFIDDGQICCVAVTRSGNPILAIHWLGGTISVHVASLVNGRLVVVHQGVYGGSRLVHDQGTDNSVRVANAAIAGKAQTVEGLRNILDVYYGRTVAA